MSTNSIPSDSTSIVIWSRNPNNTEIPASSNNGSDRVRAAFESYQKLHPEEKGEFTWLAIKCLDKQTEGLHQVERSLDALGETLDETHQKVKELAKLSEEAHRKIEAINNRLEASGGKQILKLKEKIVSLIKVADYVKGICGSDVGKVAIVASSFYTLVFFSSR